MKGVILHGGSGTRLRPLTYTDVKQLLPIAGKPVSEYVLLNLIESGVRDINIVVGEIGSKEVQDYYGDGSKWGVRISYTFQEKPLGIAHAIGLVRRFIGQDDFIVTLGDNYFQGSFQPLLDSFKKGRYDALIALTEVTNPSQFGIAEIRDGKIISLQEKPKNPRSNLAITGAYFLKPAIFPIIDNLKPSWRNELEITDAFQIMLDDGMSIGYSIISGWWKDTGTVDEFLECNRMVLDKLEYWNNHEYDQDNVKITGKVGISKNVSIRSNTTILGPCFIGDNTVIENSYIGPYTSIGNNCQIKNVEIEDSVITDSCNLDLSNKTRIARSLIGSSVSVRTSPRGNTIRLIVGRDSKIEI